MREGSGKIPIVDFAVEKQLQVPAVESFAQAVQCAASWPDNGDPQIVEAVGDVVRQAEAQVAGRLIEQPGCVRGEWDQGNLYTYRWGYGSEDVEVCLDNFLLDNGSPFSYEIGVTAMGNGRGNRKAQAGVEKFRLISDLQVSPHSLPALSLGRNVIRYRDSRGGAGKRVRITHKWREAGGNSAPAAVTAALSPETSNTLTPVLSWKPAADKAADYQVKISLREDCRWPVSMSLYRNVGGEQCEWKVPESFLNPGTTYYWKVRARDTHGAVGEWSRVFSFKTAGGAQ